MGIIDRLTAPPEKRGLSMSAAASLLSSSGPSRSGVTVSDETAMKCTTVAACVRVLAETIASLPLQVFDRAQPGRTRADGHPLQSLLSKAPNVLMSSFTLRETMQGHLGLRGNAYALIERRKRRPYALWPLRPDRMTVSAGEDEDGKSTVSYRYLRKGGGYLDLEEPDILHVRGLGGDGLVGLSPVTMHREAIGLALATEESGARFFANGTRPSGVYTHPMSLDDKSYARLKEDLGKQNAGLANTGEAILLEEGMTWQQVSLSAEDSQYLQTRQFQTQEISRMYRIPPHMVGASSGETMTYSNTEQASLEFVTYTLLPWFVRWEQEIERKLLAPRERDKYYVRHNVGGLLRADLKTRFEAYAIAISNEFLDVDEVRELEDRPPRKGSR